MFHHQHYYNQTNQLNNMKKVSQVIPGSQVAIIVEALNMMQSALKRLETEHQTINNKIFDIETLKALMNETEVVINIPFDKYEYFSQINGIDFPIYS